MGDLGIRDYLRAARENEEEILASDPEIILYLDRVDSLFRKLATGLFKGKPISGLLLLNSHASFLAAVRAAVSGQSPPTFMLLRGSLESSLYALIANENDDNATAWLERGTNIQRCRDIFTASHAARILKRVDPNLAALVGEHYGLSIDFGGHPNVRSVFDHMRLKEDKEEYNEVSLTYLHSAGSQGVIRALGACLEGGVVTVSVSAHVLADHPHAKEAHQKAWELHGEYLNYLESKGYYSPPS